MEPRATSTSVCGDKARRSAPSCRKATTCPASWCPRWSPAFTSSCWLRWAVCFRCRRCCGGSLARADLTGPCARSRVEDYNSAKHTEPEGIELHVTAIISLSSKGGLARHRTPCLGTLPVQHKCLLLLLGTVRATQRH